MEWNIQSRSKVCVGCEQVFLDGQWYHCLLEFDEEEVVRKDYCDGCWEQIQPRQKSSTDFISYWRGLIKFKPAVEKPEVLRKQTAEELLRKYLHARQPAEKNFCYILALMLERKKILIHKDTVLKEGLAGQLFIYEHSRTQEVFVVENPGLALDDLDDVQQQVKELLETEEGSETEQEPELSEETSGQKGEALL